MYRQDCHHHSSLNTVQLKQQCLVHDLACAVLIYIIHFIHTRTYRNTLAFILQHAFAKKFSSWLSEFT